MIMGHCSKIPLPPVGDNVFENGNTNGNAYSLSYKVLKIQIKSLHSKENPLNLLEIFLRIANPEKEENNTYLMEILELKNL